MSFASGADSQGSSAIASKQALMSKKYIHHSSKSLKSLNYPEMEKGNFFCHYHSTIVAMAVVPAAADDLAVSIKEGSGYLLYFGFTGAQVSRHDFCR